MHFNRKLEWAIEVVKVTHDQLQHLISLRTSKKISHHVLAPMINRAEEVHQWSRAILKDVQAAELASENKALRQQVIRLRKRLRDTQPD